MASEMKSVVVGIFESEDKAEAGASQLKSWDKASDSVKLGAMSVMSLKDGKVHTKSAGKREGRKGAKWGAIAGVVAGVLSGGLTLVAGAVYGVVAGGLLGSLKKAGASITDEQMAQVSKALEGGKSALVVVLDEGEVAAADAQLKTLGGETLSFDMPAEAMAVVEATPEVQAAAAEEPAAEAPAADAEAPKA